jgi:hypothetical protein
MSFEGNAVATITTAQMQQRIGTETVSDWVEVTQEMIDKFASTSIRSARRRPRSAARSRTAS